MDPSLSLVPLLRGKWAPTLLVAAIIVALYGISGRIALVLGPQTLPLTALDRAVPFVPATFWIYSSVYGIYFASCYLQNDRLAFRKFLNGYLLAYSLSAVFFVVYPTTFPRHLFVVPEGTGPVTRAAIEWFRTIDEPTNCFPSMHVGSCVMATMPFYKRRPGAFAFFCLWSLAIGITTVTTKQHYAVDVVAGAGFGLACHLFAFRGLHERRVGVQSQAV